MPETERRTRSLKENRVAIMQEADVTDDAFLDRRLHILQPKVGYRAAIDPVFLAASVPANADETVLDLGAGVGVASLCLAYRVAGVSVSALEVQPELARIARENVERNDLTQSVQVFEGNLFEPPRALSQTSFDHVMINPPFHKADRSGGAQNESKTVSNVLKDVSVDDWLHAALKRLKPLGTLTIVYPAEQIAQVIACISAKAGGVKIFPLWPRAGSPASRVIVSAIKSSSSPARVLPGLVLHGTTGAFSDEAERILREAKPCPIVAD